MFSIKNFFNVFKEFNDNDHIPAILAYLNTNPHLILKALIFKSSENLLNPPNSYIFRNILHIKVNAPFLWSERIDVFVTKITIFILLVFNCFFFQNIFNCNIPLNHGFPTIRNLINFLVVRKINALNELVRRTLDIKIANGA